jgi:hypothetical protein
LLVVRDAATTTTAGAGKQLTNQDRLKVDNTRPGLAKGGNFRRRPK